MIGKKETIDLLDRFFEDCLAFWLSQGKDNQEAFELALNETSQITYDPFTPMGDLLDPDVQREYINKMKIASCEDKEEYI